MIIIANYQTWKQSTMTFQLKKQPYTLEAGRGGASTSYFRSTACTLLELWGPNDGGFCALATCPALLLPVIAVRSLLWVFGAGCSVCQLASGQSILNFHVYVLETGTKSDNITSTQKKASRSMLTSFAMLTLLKMLTKLCCENPGAIWKDF